MTQLQRETQKHRHNGIHRHNESQSQRSQFKALLHIIRCGVFVFIESMQHIHQIFGGTFISQNDLIARFLVSLLSVSFDIFLESIKKIDWILVQFDLSNHFHFFLFALHLLVNMRCLPSEYFDVIRFFFFFFAIQPTLAS